MNAKPTRPKRQRAFIALGAVIALALGLLVFYPSSSTAAPKNPLAGLHHDHATFDGRVIERLSAGPYTYLEVRLADGTSRWVTVLGKGEQEGTFVHVRSFGTRERFHSKRLDRDFDVLYFALVSRSAD